METNNARKSAATYTLEPAQIEIISAAAQDWGISASAALRRIITEWEIEQVKEYEDDLPGN